QRISRSEFGFIANVGYDAYSYPAARQTGRLRQATFRHILRGTSDDPIPKGWEAFRGLKSDVATFVFPGTSERSGEVSETLDAKRAHQPICDLRLDFLKPILL
ncbi:MAG: hypothetical protein IKD42_01145, partial [Kiritimatiellae bacterium]|nr:hypothetical protein [Kiritimatiellia bacterium]